MPTTRRTWAGPDEHDLDVMSDFDGMGPQFQNNVVETAVCMVLYGVTVRYVVFQCVEMI